MRELFVVMPMGTKLAAPQHGTATLDFDTLHRDLIQAAGKATGWRVVRVDDLTRTGQITDHFIERLFAADLVLADISLPNPNVFYELGIRQAISTGGTVLIAHAGTQPPFDLSVQRILFYGPGAAGIAAARPTLEAMLRGYEAAPGVNPLRAFLERMGASSNPSKDAAAFEGDLHGRLERATNLDQLVAIWHWARNFPHLPARPLMRLAKALAEAGDWVMSVDVLRVAVTSEPADYEIHRQLGWHLRHLGAGHEDEAMAEFERALELNGSDPETLGMAGGLRKRQGRYADAANLYRRGTAISPNSTYMLVNQAALEILARPADPSCGVALYGKLLHRLTSEPGHATDAWSDVVCAEAAFATADDGAARRFAEAAVREAAPQNALRSCADQLELLASVGFRVAEARELAKLLRSGLAPRFAVGSLADAKPSPSPSAHDGRADVILHLSDVHFGKLMKDGKTVDMHRFYDDGQYSTPLAEQMCTEFRKGRRGHFQFDANQLFLVVSGDLTYTGSREEFSLASAFLDTVCRELALPKERVLLVPGNHDVNWARARVSQDERFDDYIEFLQQFYGEALFVERYPRLGWGRKPGAPRPAAHELVAIHTTRTLTLLGLNSCVYETEQHHFGFVGRRQLDLIDDLVAERAPARDAIRVAVLHHHLHPFPEPMADNRAAEELWMDLSTTRDSGLVERRLEQLGFDLVLHGHKHQAQLRQTLVHGRNATGQDSRPLIVCGAGSAGVNSKELGHNDSNHYEVIEVLRSPRRSGADFVRIEWRELAVRPDAEWATAERWTLPG